MQDLEKFSSYELNNTLFIHNQRIVCISCNVVFLVTFLGTCSNNVEGKYLLKFKN